MKYAQDFSAKALIMQDDKGNKVQFEYLSPVTEQQAITTLRKEITGRGDTTASALSLMVQILDNPRFAAYAGKIEMGHKMDPKFKAAIREQEEAHLKPLFFAQLAKKMDDAAKSEAWDAFIGELRTGGIYGNVKSYSTQYLGYFGKLPCVYDADGHPDKGRLLAVSAMSKLIANAKTDLPTKQSEGLSGELVKLAGELANRTEKTKIGGIPSAIAACKAMLVIFEGLQREEAARATENNSGAVHKDVARLADVALKQAQKANPQAVIVKGNKAKGKNQEPATV